MVRDVIRIMVRVQQEDKRFTLGLRQPRDRFVEELILRNFEAMTGNVAMHSAATNTRRKSGNRCRACY
ncbi:hypothetical protein GCM10023264_18030 [Sphingomonas daechungensis]